MLGRESETDSKTRTRRWAEQTTSRVQARSHTWNQRHPLDKKQRHPHGYAHGQTNTPVLRGRPLQHIHITYCVRTDWLTTACKTHTDKHTHTRTHANWRSHCCHNGQQRCPEVLALARRGHHQTSPWTASGNSTKGAMQIRVQEYMHSSWKVISWFKPWMLESCGAGIHHGLRQEIPRREPRKPMKGTLPARCLKQNSVNVWNAHGCV